MTVNSQRVGSTLELRLLLKRFANGFEVAAFASGRYEYDNLTMSNVLFGTRDAFKTLTLLGGFRGTTR